ncbi:uncharacterized protein CANTADRAFT_57864 [Suhomyces tanzawaensis NRRL Y-17324]|uniref:Uncharacterized protein n=1 Tax=Suhomyces tanzawaensis NRRL Y-17324 TaxID=984487 RepID=A0A1E4SAW9_9ASCO|nr:uncharacterized protein CANTADRAFT_57864 [Suhomyces tanzawaensis NRRL Y-17324]ODV76654.1 hypothetical protein CANTADRAFT_57864 [Suhomyces tanzawaensis NRRL Y-17324]
MRATQMLANAAKKGPKKVPVPVEMYPLFAAIGVAVASGCFFTYRHFAHDQQLRLWKNPDLSVLDNVLNESEKSEK